MLNEMKIRENIMPVNPNPLKIYPSITFVGSWYELNDLESWLATASGDKDATVELILDLYKRKTYVNLWYFGTKLILNPGETLVKLPDGKITILKESKK
jgi:hypothetical protein